MPREDKEYIEKESLESIDNTYINMIDRSSSYSLSYRDTLRNASGGIDVFKQIINSGRDFNLSKPSSLTGIDESLLLTYELSGFIASFKSCSPLF